MMKESRQQQLLDGRGSVARKVFEGVPIQEAWNENEILKAMRTSGVTIAAHTVRACLLDMKDVGLIKEPRRGQFQRVPVQPYLRLSAAAPSDTTCQTKTLVISEPSMPTTTVNTPITTPVDLNKASPLDALSSIATELELMSSEFGNRLKVLATRLEEVALAVETQREEDAAAMAEVKQIQTLMKALAGKA